MSSLLLESLQALWIMYSKTRGRRHMISGSMCRKNFGLMTLTKKITKLTHAAMHLPKRPKALLTVHIKASKNSTQTKKVKARRARSEFSGLYFIDSNPPRYHGGFFKRAPKRKDHQTALQDTNFAPIFFSLRIANQKFISLKRGENVMKYYGLIIR